MPLPELRDALRPGDRVRIDTSLIGVIRENENPVLAEVAYIQGELDGTVTLGLRRADERPWPAAVKPD